MTRNTGRPALLERDSMLVADCQACSGLCCVAPGFSESEEFAVDKASGDPCRHLTEGFRCAIHDRLSDHGFSGCVVYDCFGAGQKVTQHSFGGRDWRSTPSMRTQIFEVFRVMRRLHEMLIELEQALLFEHLSREPSVRFAVVAKRDELAELSWREPEELSSAPIEQHRVAVDALLEQVARMVRGEA